MPTIKKTVGQITLKVLTDVESTTYYYLLQSSMAPAPSAPTTNPPGSGWSTTEPEFFSYIPTQDTIVVSGKDYYTRSGSAGNYTYTIVSNPMGNPSTNSYYEKIYGDTRSLYVTVQTLYTDGTYDYTTPSLSSSYEAAKEAYNRAQSALTIAGDINQYFWALSSSYSTDVPAGVYVTNIPQNQFKSAPAQGNILMQSSGITIRNGAISLASLTGTALNFYNPITHEANATLSSGGLILSKGGIRVNTVGSNNGVYISSDNLGSSIPLDNNIKTNWRAVIGSKFGVDSEGNLYANNANIEGAITATSLTIGSGSSAYDGAAAINISGYDIEIEKNGTDEVEDVSVYLYPILYHNGEKVADYIQSTDTSVDSSKTYYIRSGSAGSYVYTEVTNPSGNPSQIPYYEKQIDYSHFIWYQDDDTIGTEGDGNNSGRYLATYGHNYRVIYDFDDGAVGGGTEVQTRTVDPSKYITKVSDTGITIHPEVWSNQSSYIQLDGTGMELFNSNGNSIAQYGSTARVGLNNSSRFLMNNNSLEAYDSNNNKYFEVSANGLSYGNNNVISQDVLEDTLSNYLIDINSQDGVIIKAVNSTFDTSFETDNYIKINASGLSLYRSGNNIASFGEITAIGKTDGSQSYLKLDYHSMQAIDKEGDYYFYVSDLRNADGVAEMSETMSAIYSDSTTIFCYTTLVAYDWENEMEVYADDVLLTPVTGYTYDPTSNIKKISIYKSEYPDVTVDSNIVVNYLTIEQKTKAYTFGLRNDTANVGVMSIAMGINTVASDYCTLAWGSGSQALGRYSCALGERCKALKTSSHAEGCATEAGYHAHAEGLNTRATGNYSHAQGSQSKATGKCAHAEGESTEASGNRSHTEGCHTLASGTDSHAGGWHSEATANYAFSHGYYAKAQEDKASAFGTYTLASSPYQFVIGKYNVEDASSTYAFIIGKGTDTSARSNAMQVDWNGKTTIASTLVQNSDRRLKKHINYLNEDAVNFIRGLKPAHYIKDEENQLGFYAQDVEKIDTWNALIGEMNGYKTLSYTELIAPLVAYCQHLEKRIEELEEK